MDSVVSGMLRDSLGEPIGGAVSLPRRCSYEHDLVRFVSHPTTPLVNPLFKWARVLQQGDRKTCFFTFLVFPRNQY